MREIKHLSVHQSLRSAIPDSQQPTSPIGFLFLKLPPPPCAILLVSTLYLLEYKNIDPYPFMPFVNKDGFTNQHWGFKDLAWRHKGIEPFKWCGEKRMSNPTKSYKPSSISRHVQFLDELLKIQSL